MIKLNPQSENIIEFQFEVTGINNEDLVPQFIINMKTYDMVFEGTIDGDKAIITIPPLDRIDWGKQKFTIAFKDNNNRLYHVLSDTFLIEKPEVNVYDVIVNEEEPVKVEKTIKTEKGGIKITAKPKKPSIKGKKGFKIKKG